MAGRRSLNWLKFIGLLILECYLAVGCGGNLRPQTEEMEESEMEERVALTPEQEKFLIEISMDEDRVKEGKLYNWQVEVLKQYDAALEYLYKKYPSHKFDITSCTIKSQENSYATFWYNADGQEKNFELYLEVGEDGNYSCEDSFYGYLLKEDYEKTLLEILQEPVPECIAVDSQISAAKGVDYDETLTAEDIIGSDEKLPNQTMIFAVENQNRSAERIAEEIETVIDEKKIYGGYTIAVLRSVPEGFLGSEDIVKYVREQGETIYQLKKNFQQFD